MPELQEKAPIEPSNDPPVSASGRYLQNSAHIFGRAVHIWFKDLIDLRVGLDREGTIEFIKSSKMMRGANTWLLMCSIMVASLGLDLGSPAVIIGAMLISPLMAPILGIGLGVAINDRYSLFLAIRQFSIAILIAILTSTLYFLITPLGSLTAEIQARTAPTFLDGLVAVFGGLAGIISISRKEPSSAIPGVAIATALMPPLCVTGFGIANGNWLITLNSFYLFFLNSFFIALTAFLIIRLLRFPLKERLDEQQGRRTRLIIILFSIIITVPSAYLLYKIWQKRNDEIKIENFVQQHFNTGSRTTCLGYSLIKQDTSRQLILQLLGEYIPEDSVEIYQSQLASVGLHPLRFTLIQNTDVGLDQVTRMQLQLSNMNALVERLQQTTANRAGQTQFVSNIQTIQTIAAQDSILFSNLSKEVKVLFPTITELRFARMRKTNFQDTPIVPIPTYLVRWKVARSRAEEESKLREFFKVRTQLDTFEILAY